MRWWQMEFWRQGVCRGAGPQRYCHRHHHLHRTVIESLSLMLREANNLKQFLPSGGHQGCRRERRPGQDEWWPRTQPFKYYIVLENRQWMFLRSSSRSWNDFQTILWKTESLYGGNHSEIVSQVNRRSCYKRKMPSRVDGRRWRYEILCSGMLTRMLSSDTGISQWIDCRAEATERKSRSKEINKFGRMDVGQTGILSESVCDNKKLWKQKLINWTSH